MPRNSNSLIILVNNPRLQYLYNSKNIHIFNLKESWTQTFWYRKWHSYFSSTNANIGQSVKNIVLQIICVFLFYSFSCHQQWWWWWWISRKYNCNNNLCIKKRRKNKEKKKTMKEWMNEKWKTYLWIWQFATL